MCRAERVRPSLRYLKDQAIGKSQSRFCTKQFERGGNHLRILN